MRHVATGDQAGFALGNFFLVAWFLPIAAIALLIGAILLPGRRAAEHRRSGWTWVLAIVLAACAGFILIYGASFEVPGVWPSSGSTRGLMPHSFVAATLAFAANVLACVLAVWMTPASHGRVGPRLLSGILLVASAGVLFQVAGTVGEFIRERYLLVHLPWATGLSLIWAAALLRSAWVLHRRPLAPALA